jgi:hypothetical protein
MRFVFLVSYCFIASSCFCWEAFPFSLRVAPLGIPQVDYEPYLRPGYYGLPTLDLKSVNFSHVINKTHTSVTLENEHLHVVILPEMGRVYRIVSKPTGHDVLWRNDVATPGGANNKLGWWLWIGGIEYTLPGEEHGYTWAIPWKWTVTENSTTRKAIQLTVREPSTGLLECLTLSLGAGSSSLRTDIVIKNPGLKPAAFAHWTNVPMVPGGKNELLDDTTFEIPTKEVLIAKRWQQNLGQSPQNWQTSQLRNISGWKGGMGDFTAKDLTAGYFGAYTALEDEGALRIFNSTVTPGLDTWTYGFHPQKGVIPGEEKRSTGYAEMWGGNVKTFPNERAPISGNNATITWTEWIHPYHSVREAPLVFADSTIIVHADWDEASSLLTVYFSHASSDLQVTSIELRCGEDIVDKKVFVPVPRTFRKYSVKIKSENIFDLKADILLNHTYARSFQLLK